MYKKIEESISISNDSCHFYLLESSLSLWLEVIFCFKAIVTKIKKFVGSSDE